MAKIKEFDLYSICRETQENTCKNVDFNLELSTFGVCEPLLVEEMAQNITFDFKTYQSFEETVCFYIIAHNWTKNTTREIGWLYIKENGRLKKEYFEPVLYFIDKLNSLCTY